MGEQFSSEEASSATAGSAEPLPGPSDQVLKWALLENLPVHLDSEGWAHPRVVEVTAER